MPARPWKRMCEMCGHEFRGRSNSRKFCFDCSPAQGRADRAAKGPLPGEVGPGAPPQKPHIPTTEEVESEKTPPEILQSAARRNYSKVKKNGKGMIVDTHHRQPGGWGKCRSLDPETRREICDSERFNISCPFCYDHMNFWREEEMGRKAKVIAEKILSKADEKKAVVGIDAEMFEVETAEDALKLLSKLNVMLAREQLLPETVRAIRENILAQIRAIDTMMTSERLKVLAELKARKKDGPIDDEELDEDSLELDLDILKRSQEGKKASSDKV